MRQIKIGTCIPGHMALDIMGALAHSGFESYSVNYHMECPHPDLKELAQRLTDAAQGVPITVMGYYCNALVDEAQRDTLARFIDNARHFGVSTIATFAGGLPGESVEAAMPAFKRAFAELAKRAEDSGVRLALENCPMDGGWDRVTCNIAFNPRAWEMLFDAVPSDALGLQWEPAHQMGQLIEPLPQLRDWAHKVIHVHGKDGHTDRDLIARRGIEAGVEFFRPRTPGFGDTDWRQVIALLQEAGYAGDIAIEGFHDHLYNGDWELTGQLHALQYLKWCRGGEFAPTPWEA